MQRHVTKLLALALAFVGLSGLARAQCEVGELTHDDVTGFGGVLAADGNALVVGPGGGPQGMRFYERDDRGTADPRDDAWLELPAAFGWAMSMAMEGDRILLGTGAPPATVLARDDAGTPADPFDDTWAWVDDLYPADATPNDFFGMAVALSGPTALLGSVNFFDDGLGSAYVFVQDDNGTPVDPFDDAWIEQAKLLASDGVDGDLLGTACWLQGTTAFVGAGGDDLIRGAVYVFERDDQGTADPLDDVWTEIDKLVASDAAEGHWFGGSLPIGSDDIGQIPLAASGSTLFVAAIGHTGARGAVYAFERDDQGTADPFDDRWVEVDQLAPAGLDPGDRFGTCLAVSGARLVVTAPRDDDLGTDAGAAYVFLRDDNGTPSDPFDDSWVEEAKITGFSTHAYDRFGRGLAVTGQTAYVGAPGFGWDPDPGSVHAFELDVTCPFTLYGEGLAGTGGLVPQIDGAGTPAVGTSFTVEIADGLGAAPGVLLGGSHEVAIPLLDGTLLVLPVLYRQGHVLAGAPGVAGAGTASLPVALPNDPSLVGAVLRFQALYLDPGASRRYSFTRGLRVAVGP